MLGIINMFQVTIKNLQGIQTHGGKFKTETEADAWILEQIFLKSWGEPSNYTVEKTDITAEIALENQKRIARNLKRSELKAVKGKSLSSSEIKTVVEYMIEILPFDNEALE